MRKRILVFGTLLLSSLFSLGFTMGNSPRPEIPESEKSVNALLGKIAKVLVEKHSMRVSGTSVAMPDGDVMELGLRFDICGPLTKVEIRALLVDCAQTFLGYVNADERVHPHLNHYPFVVEDLDIILFMKDSRHAGLRDPHIGIAGIGKGELYYSILQDEDCVLLKRTIKIGTIKSEEVESFAEALAAIKREQEGTAQ